jgi:antirestriction protein ArdC
MKTSRQMRRPLCNRRIARRTGLGFIASELGISTDIPQHANYLADWIKPLKLGRSARVDQ